MGAKAKKKADSGESLLPVTARNDLEGIELFFGLVNPTGADLDAAIKTLKGELDRLDYHSEEISFSDLIREYCGLKKKPYDEYKRIKDLMDRGTDLREENRSGDFIAKLALLEVRNRREIRGERRTAYILRSFKRKEEVDLFRQVYGKAFNLISVYSPFEDRFASLTRRIAETSKRSTQRAQPLALELINRDQEEEGREFGQNVLDTFPLADCFVSLSDAGVLRAELRRFIELIFNDPFLTPTKAELSMFLAQAMALRSADLSRQVGAVIATGEGEMLAAGCNEVPKAFGGLYWGEDPNRQRDCEIGEDKNAKTKRQLAEDLLHRLKEGGWLAEEYAGMNDADLFEKATIGNDAVFRDGQFQDVIEYGRTVHAEMAALSDAAKRGVSVSKAILYCTTFPCHLCARHIVAAGIAEVVYISPYPKSRSGELFADSIAINPKSRVPDKVNFMPFVGVAPRRYFDLFQMSGKRKTDDGAVIRLGSKNRTPRLVRYILSYRLLEDRFIREVPRSRGQSGTTRRRK